MSGRGGKIGRNDTCPCGSGRKFKRCCLGKSRIRTAKIKDLESKNPRLAEAIKASLSPAARDKERSIELWQGLGQQADSGSSEQLWAVVNQAQAYKNLGQHRKALELFDTVTDALSASPDLRLQIWARTIACASCSALGRTTVAAQMAEEALSLTAYIALEPQVEGSVLLEAGNAYRKSGAMEKARQCWERAVRLFAGNSEWKASYVRALSNLALLLLDDPDEERQADGVRSLEQASDMKLVMGDLEGLANNYGNLGMYFWRKNRYGRALAYLRRDLAITRLVGNATGLVATLNNLAIVYGHAKQLKPARLMLREAKDIAEGLGDNSLQALTQKHLEFINQVGKEAGLKHEKLGPKVSCACGSGQPYEDCCGRADHEPMESPARFAGMSQDFGDLYRGLEKAGKKPSLLDLTLRESDEAHRRMSWNGVEGHDGWQLWRELADMANLHLSSAKSLAESARAEPDSLAHPLSCIILSVCALEAFINQAAYFAATGAKRPEADLPALPAELVADHEAYQRHTELTEKWLSLGKALCGNGWPPEPLWTEFRNLVLIRNELVHFKVLEFEQTIPPPKDEHPILQKAPATVEKRDVPRSWPFRLLTPGVATWASGVADSLITAFRRGYSRV